MAEGKTKIITPLWPDCHVGEVFTKDDITAKDGKIRAVMDGKGELSTRTTCNVFEMLQVRGVPLAYIGRDGPKTFLTQICEMIPVEVVVRRIATGSYLKRNPNVFAGFIFEEPLIEFFYKTKDRRIGDMELPCDDPLMVLDESLMRYQLHQPDKAGVEAYIGQLHQDDDDATKLIHQLAECSVIATDINTHLRDAWRSVEGTLYDFKVEFGVLPDGRLVGADVIDCDSWRVKWEEIQLSKQPFRDNPEELAKVKQMYRIAASLTDRFVRRAPEA
jgi:phosphoribosylaminoimidazole-succinocarboxamide synthase